LSVAPLHFLGGNQLARPAIMTGTDTYDELIMEHIRNARNYRAPKRPQLEAKGSNPLCGDEMVLYLEFRRGRIEDIAFQCTCCGISMASASIMTELLQGGNPAEAKGLIRAFLALLDGRDDSAVVGPTAEQEAILATVRKFPSRARCAALPWTTLDSILEEPAAARRAR
jgi:nitrogen fixation protein NifU and related proteins